MFEAKQTIVSRESYDPWTGGPRCPSRESIAICFFDKDMREIGYWSLLMKTGRVMEKPRIWGQENLDTLIDKVEIRG